MRKIAILALAVAFLTGCAQIPTSLDVKSGPEIANQIEQEFAYYTPAGPVVGASQQEIVSGFLAAGTGPQNDYAVARSFLSQDFAQRWKPDAAVLIRSGAPSFRESGEGLQIVSLNISARLDEHGGYSASEDSETVSLRFQLVREQGEWRIASAPNLTVVTPPVFSVVFSPFNLYFFDSQQRRLVADVRWFPTRVSTGTRLVNALLAGPSAWLESAVLTAIPAGTKLTIDAVRVEDGVAQVDFDSTALGADAIERRLMLSQLRATLLQLSGVNEVALSVNSSPQDITPAAVIPLRSGSDGLALKDGVSRFITSDGPLPGTRALVERLTPSLFASNAAGNRIAFASASGVFMLTGGGLSTRTELLSEISDVAALEFDAEGLLWVFPRASGSEILIFNEVGDLKSTILPALGERVHAELSPEGVSLAVILQTGGAGKVELFTVQRDVMGIPSKINRGFELGLVLGNPVSLAWQSQSALRVIERTASGMTALSEYPTAGPRQQLAMPPVPGLKIISGPTSFTSYLLGENQEVWNLSGGSWRRVASEVIDINSQG